AQQKAAAAPAGAATAASPAAPSAAHRNWFSSALHFLGRGGQTASDPPATNAAAKGAAAAPAAAAEPAKTAPPAASAAPAKTAPPAASATPATPAEYRLGAGDLLDIQVWHEPEISGKVPIRPDGKIAIPLAGEITAAGLTPGQLKTIITEKLRAYISVPAVTVIVEQVNSRSYNVLGRVAHPGTYVLNSRTRVLDALARAGGLSEFAHPDHIYILRANAAGEAKKLKFDYKHVIAGRDDAQDIVIQPGDTVVVP
ncbi:MAG: polysaccharide biosynthesis/export family protein, partial [Terriglobales bacterium]